MDVNDVIGPTFLKSAGFEIHQGVWFKGDMAYWDGDICQEYSKGRYAIKGEAIYSKSNSRTFTNSLRAKSCK